MKKICLMLLCILILSGCGTNNKTDIKNDLVKNVKKLSSYKITGTMEILNDEDSMVYNVESSYLKPDYYKVVMMNEINNHEQIILKNKEGTYVITPALNKSFKFQSDWPNNSSQIYLIDIIVKDIENDTNASIEEKNGNYIIKSIVNYTNNAELKSQKIYLDKNQNIEKVEIIDSDEKVRIKFNITNLDYKTKLKEDIFNLDNYIKPVVEDKKEENNNQKCENETCPEQEPAKETLNIENIIYPLYIPSDTFLASSEKISTDNGNRVILTFNGDKSFVLIEQMAVSNTDMEILPVYGEPIQLYDSIGALSANSLSWDSGNISYYLASTDLSVDEMKSIANSLGNYSAVAKTK